ncbi:MULTISPECIES: hypothetical protein [Pseudochrobactrum]|uniref:Putative lipoprotein with Yx(FWY)xxD motif n=2 Tax=Pseudochrobactrum TaxID=354349 RepID=A0A7W8ALV7_9HYPH|nr:MULTISPECIES: hypothetical protein [Pseudochrobactrum]MBB5092721.1 putative lipoprotein with Yx(FWY)xxD motif [Pseudochrobactrum saccharolyticum]UCA46573.1 hypothetical protein LDL70_04865 [Pseudochrobactrum sp. XF203]
MKKLVLTLSVLGTVLGLSAAPVFAGQTAAAASKTDMTKMQHGTDKAAGGPGMMMDAAGGKILTTAEGHTLYTFDKDSGGMSNCDASCLKIWPAYHASAKTKAVAPWSKVKASDGKDMWAYNGKPVYTYIKDKKAGDMEGDGVGGNWHVIK